jgi:hypothetical protein
MQREGEYNRKLPKSRLMLKIEKLFNRRTRSPQRSAFRYGGQASRLNPFCLLTKNKSLLYKWCDTCDIRAARGRNLGVNDSLDLLVGGRYDAGSRYLEVFSARSDRMQQESKP